MPLTTQLLLPSSSCGSLDTRALCTFEIRWRYSGTISSDGSASGPNGLPSPRLTAVITSSVINFGSSPWGTTRSSHGSGAAALLAAGTPIVATFMASLSSCAGVLPALSRPTSAQRSVNVFAVHGSGLIPVSLNSTGRLFAFCVTHAFNPLAHAVKSRSASG